jgi:anti-anti-sigma regulatory factor
VRGHEEFTYERKDEGAWTRFVLAGPVTEYAREALRRLAAEKAGQAVLDLRGVPFANSTGIRDWAYMLKEFKNGKTVVFEHVPDEIIRTMNMILGFRQSIPIRSLFRMYCCDSCNHEFRRTMIMGRDYDTNRLPTAKKLPCESCGQEASPPDPDEDFFMFLTEAA